MEIWIFMCLLIMYVWWRDIIREGTIEGQHTKIVQDGLRMGMILFIVSEVMFSLHSSGHFFIQVLILVSL